MQEDISSYVAPNDVMPLEVLLAALSSNAGTRSECATLLRFLLACLLAQNSGLSVHQQDTAEKK